MFNRDMNIADYDPELWQSITGEVQRQEDHIELIASENYASADVMEAAGSILQINIQKDTLEEDIMRVKNLSIKLKTLLLKEQKNCLGQNMLMFNL